MQDQGRLEAAKRAIIEKRTFEAAKKEVSKKLQTIVRYLGRPVVEQISNVRNLPDFWELEENEDDFRALMADEDIREVLVGYYFDGLKCGINLTIQTLIYEDKIVETKAHYNGYPVFCESEGRLEGYAPFDEWENHLNMFYSAAIPVEQAQKTEAKKISREINKRENKEALNKFKRIWGI